MSIKRRGFASLSPELLRLVSSKGGKAHVKKGFATLTKEQLTANGKRAVAIRIKNKEKTNE